MINLHLAMIQAKLLRLILIYTFRRNLKEWSAVKLKKYPVAEKN